MSNTNRIEEQLGTVLSLISNVLSEAQRDDIQMYIRAGEWGLALETICDFLYEDNLPLSAHTYSLIQEIGTMLHLNSNTWEILESQVIK